MKLKLQGEHIDQQQEKYDTYLNLGFKLKRTRRTKDGLTIRTYIKK